MQVQDVRRVSALGRGLAVAFASEAGPDLGDEAREEILARRSSPATARRAMEEVEPLWKRWYWQKIHLAGNRPDDLRETVGAMVADFPEEDRKRAIAIADRMADGFRGLRAGLASECGEEALRAVLVEPGKGGSDEAMLARRRERDD